MNTHDLAESEKIRKRQVHLLYMQAPISNITVLAISVLFYFIVNARYEWSLTGWWIAALYTTATFRLILWLLYRRKPTLLTASTWLNAYMIGTALVGISWSPIYTLIFITNDPIISNALFMLVFGVVGSSVVILSIHYKSFLVYAYPQILTLIGTLLMFGDMTHNLFVVGVIAYLIMTTLFTLNINRNALKAIHLQEQNDSLIEKLNHEVDQRDAIVQQQTTELTAKNLALRNEIKEKSRVENALRESEQRLSAFFDASPAGMALLDTEFKHLLINETLAKYSSLSRQEHIGKTLSEVLPHTEETVLANLRKVLDTQQPITNTHLSITVPSRPDRTSHFIASFFPILNADQTIHRIGIVVIDDTDRKLAELALKKSEERFELAMRGANDGLYDWDLINNQIYFSPRWKEILGYTNDELANDFSVWENLVDPIDREKAWDMLNAYINGERDSFNMEFKMQHKDGHWVDILSRAFLVRDNTGKPTRIVGTHLDISQLKQQEQEIQLLSQAVEQSPASVVITDTNANIEYVNQKFEEVTGYNDEEVIGKNPNILKSGQTPSKRYQEMWQTLLDKQTWTGEIQNRKKNGEIYWEHAQIAPVIDSKGEVTHYMAIKEDITEKKRQEERIIHQAHYDSLTGLPNRFLALDRLSQMIKESERSATKVAVLFLDLDGFKRVNDSMGHESGDSLLTLAANRLSESVREEDTVCRLGGDEFIVLIKGLEKSEDARQVASNLIARFREPVMLEGRELVITTSIGIAMYPTDGLTPAELLRNSDTAMYHAKDLGRNTYQYFTAEMNKNVSRRLAVEEQLHGALAREEFTILYQPIIDLANHSIVGAEALLRWNNDALGSISPEEFIPIAEQTGSIVEIGEHVLQQALVTTSELQSIYGHTFKIAVNVSPRQFRNPNLTNSIKAVLDEHKIEPCSLELEITEGVLMSGHAYVEDALNKLEDLGINISMDDFGTGYSSLSYLRSYPFRVLKIDRTFIKDITTDPADRELVNAAILMAHGLDLKVVAEGVETQEQLDFLSERGCDYAQGYLFSKPIPKDQFSNLQEQIAFNN